MTDLELIFTMLGEKVTTEISKNEKPETFEDNRKVARRGGKVAGNARKETEKELGRSVCLHKISWKIEIRMSMDRLTKRKTLNHENRKIWLIGTIHSFV